MELSEQIKSDLPSAMKSGEATKVSTLRLVLSSMHNLEIEKRKKGKEGDRKSTRLNSSHIPLSRMPSSA